MTNSKRFIPQYLKKYANVQGGYAFKSSEFQENGIPIIRIGDIKNNRIVTENCAKVNEKYLSICKNYIIQNGDILIAMTGATVGKIALNTEKKPLLLNQRVGRFICNTNILPKYLYYVLLSDAFYNKVQYKASGAGQPNISPTEIGNIRIPVPPSLEEQQEIVDVLDAASEIIRLRTACIESAQSLIPALFQEMFGDINNNIYSLPISEIKSCVEINPTKIVMNDNDDVTFLGMKDVTENGQIDLSTIKKYEEVKKGFTSFKNDDVLLAKITPCFENGKAAIAKNLVNNTGFGSTEFYVLRPNQNKILPEYLYSIVKSSRFSEMGRSNMKGAAGQKRLIKDFVSNYKFLLPDIPQQKLFAAKVQEIEEYIKTQQAELENAKTMFQSLLHHSFTGELTRHKFGGDANG